MLLLTLLISFFIQNDGEKIILKNTPEKNSAIKLTNMKKYITEEGFYKYTRSTVAPNGKVICYDAGNLVVNIFDADGTLEHSFGKEGNGPGEFVQNYIWRVLATDKYIYTQQWDKIMVFDYKGNLINETKGIEYFQKSILQLKDGKLITLFHQHPNRKFLKIKFSETGEVLEEVKNPNYQKINYRKDLPTFYGELYTTPNFRYEYNNTYIEPDHKDYKIHIYDLNRKHLRTLERAFERVKQNTENMWFNRKTAGMSKKAASRNEQIGKVYNSIYDGKWPAISSLSGVYNGYLFVTAFSGDEDKLTIDVISPDNTFYTQLEINDKDINYINIVNGKVIASCRNDDEGPYIKTFDIEIN